MGASHSLMAVVLSSDMIDGATSDFSPTDSFLIFLSFFPREVLQSIVDAGLQSRLIWQVTAWIGTAHSLIEPRPCWDNLGKTKMPVGASHAHRPDDKVFSEVSSMANKEEQK